MRSPEAMSAYEMKGRGFRVIEQPQIEEKTRPTPGDTAEHEAKHVVAAIFNGTGVSMVTIEPGPGYGGLTQLDRPDAVAAAAPHAMGHSGTSHDIRIVELMGHSSDSLSGIASSIISQHKDEVTEIATVLEEKRTMGSYDIYEAINNVEKKKWEKKKKSFIVIGPDGEEKNFKQVSSDSELLMVPGKWINFSQKAEK